MERLLTWLCSEETHRFSNCVCVSVLGHLTRPEMALLDRDGVPGVALQQLVTRLGSVQSLVNKPKMVLLATSDEGEWHVS